MIVLLSPAKTMKETPLNAEVSVFHLLFPEKAATLAAKLKEYNKADIKQLMKVSDAIAEKTDAMHKKLEIPVRKSKGIPALALYKGHVYQHMQVATYSEKDWEFAQKTIRILSGLYGVLRPLDAIMPYRLEMRYRTKEWKSTLTEYFLKINEPIVNLASKEYSDAIELRKLSVPIVTPIFKEKKGNTYSIVRVYTKFARGLMADWIITHGITDYRKLTQFNVEGYTFSKKDSNESEYVFLR